ncbi:unnamed protein product [Mucor hiemalis]
MSKFENLPPTFNEQVFISSLGKLKTSRKRYDCNQCSKFFTRPSALQTHIYTHTGEKPHSCDIPGCGRRFAVISNLRRHLRVHRPSHVRRRLTSQERREYVENLIKRSGSSEMDESGSIDEGHVNYNSFPSMCYSSSSSTTSSTSSSPRQSMSPHMETTTYRLLKPKSTKPLCLTVQHLLN